MSRRSEENLRGLPMKPYDFIREGLIVLAVVFAVVITMAATWGSPDYPTLTGQAVAERDPVAYLETAANTLAGKSGISGYGPPYTPDRENAQRVLGIAPADWFTLTIPIDPVEDLVLKPLERVGVLRQDVAAALEDFRSAPTALQTAWTTNYLSALDEATVVEGQVQLPSGDYGPVDTMMTAMLDLGRAGLLEGALESGDQLPFTVDFTRSLLFFEGDVAQAVARKLDLLSEQWGVSHETGPYPGAWWLWPFTFFYQIEPMRSSPNGDLQVAFIVTGLFVLIVLLPLIPILNRLPRWIGLYKIIWRDWYRRKDRP
jgi:hypothetical protein